MRSIQLVRWSDTPFGMAHEFDISNNVGAEEELVVNMAYIGGGTCCRSEYPPNTCLVIKTRTVPSGWRARSDWSFSPRRPH